MPEENEEWVDLGSAELDALDTRTELSSERFWQSPNLSSPSSSKSGSGTLIGSAFSRVPSPAVRSFSQFSAGERAGFFRLAATRLLRRVEPPKVQRF